MTWNYRIILMDVSSPDEPWYEVHEVIYKDGEVALYTQDAIKPSGSSPQELLNELLLMAYDGNRHPVLKESELPRI